MSRIYFNMDYIQVDVTEEKITGPKLRKPELEKKEKSESASDVAIQKIKRLINTLKDCQDVPISTSVVVGLLEGAIKGTITEEKIEREVSKLKNPVERRLESI